jgi:hypothetical protein
MPRFRRSGRSGRAFAGLAAGIAGFAAKLGEAGLASTASTGSARCNPAQVTVTIENLMPVRAGTFNACTMCPGQASNGGGRGTARAAGRCVKRVSSNVPQLLAGGPDAWRYPAHCNADGIGKGQGGPVAALHSVWRALCESKARDDGSE